VGVRVLKLRFGQAARCTQDLSLVATPVGISVVFGHYFGLVPFVYMLPFVLDVYTVRYCRSSRGDDNHAKGGG